MKILVFAPHSAIWVHAFPEALVVEALAQAGHDMRYVTCGRSFTRQCVPMSDAGLTHEDGPERRAAVCDRCDANARLIRDSFGFAGSALADELTGEDRAQARALAEQATPADFLALKIDGVEIGRAALGTFLLLYKKISFDFSPKEWAALRTELQHTLLSFFGARRLFDRERPDRLLVYSSGYSVNLVVCRLAEARGISQYYMNAGSNITDRLQKVVLARGSSLQRRLIDHWPAYRARPCPPGAMRYVTDHFIELMRGRSGFVYSPARVGNADAVRASLGVPEGRKVLLATMSSYDELFAAEATGLFSSDYRTPFATQVDWLRALIDWCRGRSDVYLLIRVHPREFPNRRDGVKSEHAHQLEAAFSDLPANCRVNWPSDGISLYDIAEFTDVCLNSWSTAGKEMTLLGIPTVIYAPDLVFYAADLNYVGETSVDYFAQVERALADGWSIEHCRRMFRWQALEDSYSRIDISDSFRRDENHRPSLPARAVHRGLRMLDPLWREKRDCRRRAIRLKAAPLIGRILGEGRESILDVRPPGDLESATEAEETQSLRRELRRLMAALYSQPQALAAAGTLRARLQGFVFEG